MMAIQMKTFSDLQNISFDRDRVFRAGLRLASSTSYEKRLFQLDRLQKSPQEISKIQ